MSGVAPACTSEPCTILQLDTLHREGLPSGPRLPATRPRSAPPQPPAPRLPVRALLPGRSGTPGRSGFRPRPAPPAPLGAQTLPALDDTTPREDPRLAARWAEGPSTPRADPVPWDLEEPGRHRAPPRTAAPGLGSSAIKEFFSKPKYNHILKPEDCLSEPCTILQLDTRTVQIADLGTTSGELHFEIRKAGALHGFTAWFSVRFQSPEEDEPQLVLSTGPFHPTTHWRQVLFMMDEPVSVLSGDVVTGSVVLQRNPVWRRHMSVALSWSVTSTQDPTSQKVGEKVFPIWRRRSKLWEAGAAGTSPGGDALGCEPAFLWPASSPALRRDTRVCALPSSGLHRHRVGLGGDPSPLSLPVSVL
ncbi:uncharacterized protein [Vulpes vulpes]|uniref:Protein arginine N-methyltransferase domain-containing protein n=1 Tax=Vulpes vulpes TaxID=9627 RepID=A0ABM4ZFX4_VULVU